MTPLIAKCVEQYLCTDIHKDMLWNEVGRLAILFSSALFTDVNLCHSL